MTSERAAQLRPLLAELDDPSAFTEDERACLGILLEALDHIAAGGDLSPPDEGTQKLRLIRRVAFSFFHPLAPRDATVTAPKTLPPSPIA